MPRAKDRKSKLLKIECGLHLAQMIEPGLGAVASQIVGGIRHVLFGILDGLDELAGVKLDEVYGRLLMKKRRCSPPGKPISSSPGRSVVKTGA